MYDLTMVAVELPHLHRDSKGDVWIDESGFRVLDLIREHLAHGWGAEMIQDNHPQLSLAQIHAALSWFYDHEDEFLREISRREKLTEVILEAHVSVSVQNRLRSLKNLREA